MKSFVLLLRELIIAEGELKTLSEHRFPAIVSFEIARLLDAIAPHVRAFNDAKNTAIMRYGEPDAENPEITRVTSENRDTFSAEMSELLNSSVEIPGEKLRLAWLAQIDLTPDEIWRLRPLIQDPSEE